MSRTVAQLAASLTVNTDELTAAVVEICELGHQAHRMPKHITGRVKALCASDSPITDGWVDCELTDGVYHLRPSPKIMALMTDIRAQNPQAETLQ